MAPIGSSTVDVRAAANEGLAQARFEVADELADLRAVNAARSLPRPPSPDSVIDLHCHEPPLEFDDLASELEDMDEAQLVAALLEEL